MHKPSNKKVKQQLCVPLIHIKTKENIKGAQIPSACILQRNSETNTYHIKKPPLT